MSAWRQARARLSGSTLSTQALALHLTPPLPLTPGRSQVARPAQCLACRFVLAAECNCRGDPCRVFCDKFSSPECETAVSLQPAQTSSSQFLISCWHWPAGWVTAISSPRASCLTKRCLMMVSMLGRGHGTHLGDLIQKTSYATPLWAQMTFQTKFPRQIRG